jgi:ferritin-like metal-binding protein YciE
VLADQLGMTEASNHLNENLQEEKAALDELSSFVEDYDYETVSEQTAD